MSKELILVRHGKSAWENENLSDIDRPLKDRGLRDAYKMSQLLATKNIKPDRIYSSIANRALHTATIFSRNLNIKPTNIEIRENLYLADVFTIQQLVQNLRNDYKQVMIFGHNPGFTDLANLFINDFLANLPTCGIVQLKFDINNWDSVSKKAVIEENLYFPKEIK